MTTLSEALTSAAKAFETLADALRAHDRGTLPFHPGDRVRWRAGVGIETDCTGEVIKIENMSPPGTRGVGPVRVAVRWGRGSDPPTVLFTRLDLIVRVEP